MDHIQKTLQLILKETTMQRNFRRQNFTEAQFKHLKWKLIEFTESYFFETDGKIVLTPEEQKNLSKIFNWLVGYKINISLNKGLLLTGDYGTGKSVLMKAALKFIETYYSDKVVPNGIPQPLYLLSHDMSNAFKDNNTYLINRMKSASVLAIDDLGYESKTVQYFGTDCHPFEEVIMTRYDKRKTTLITTNLSLKQIEDMYQKHVEERVRQMVYLIEFRGNSKRK